MLGQDEHETDTKNWTSTNSASEVTNPFELVKNKFRLLNHSILMSSEQTQTLGEKIERDALFVKAQPY